MLVPIGAMSQILAGNADVRGKRPGLPRPIPLGKKSSIQPGFACSQADWPPCCDHGERRRQTMSNQAEQDRINHVYRQWHGGAGLARYAWHRPDVLLHEADRARVLAALLRVTVGADLSNIRAVDVGCGHGGFLRQLINWGANPAALVGTELQQDRL